MGPWPRWRLTRISSSMELGKLSYWLIWVGKIWKDATCTNNFPSSFKRDDVRAYTRDNVYRPGLRFTLVVHIKSDALPTDLTQPGVKVFQ